MPTAVRFGANGIRSGAPGGEAAPGQLHSAEGWEELLLPEIDRQLAQGKEVAFRGDAAFAKPEVYESVEERKAKYAIRLATNDNLERKVAQLLTRPVGKTSYKPVVRYKSFHDQAAIWTKARGVVAKVEFHFGKLFPRVRLIVTNFRTSSRALGPPWARTRSTLGELRRLVYEAS